MRAEEIIRYLQDPSSLNEDSLPKLREMIQEYPYFQTARLLYLLNLFILKDSDLKKELRNAAIYAGDRRSVFYRIESKYYQSLHVHLPGNTEEPEVADDAFSLIDSFLADKGEQISRTNASESRQELVSNDYLSTLFSDNNSPTTELSHPLFHQDVIDRFLEADKEAPVKIELKEPTEETIPVDLASSEVDETSFFSETLAKIYLKQKKYEKALEIIRKLNLLYPEKNIYFADQIRFLEKLIINNKKTE